MGKQAKVTPQAARAAIKVHGGLRPAARALGIDCGFLHRISKRADADGATETVDGVAGPQADAINLSPATRICDRRPPVTVRSKFFSLAKGKAYRISQLSRQWGFSAETIKKHARDEGCFGYVDTTGHDDFEECVMHPETAASRLKGNK